MIRSILLIPLLTALMTSWAYGARPDLDAGLADLTTANSLIEAQTAAQLLKDQFGLTDLDSPLAVAKSGFATGGNPVIDLVDMRLLLAQIAVQTGAKDHLSLVRAQASDVHKVILLRGGLVTLAQLQSLMATSDAADFVVIGPEGVTLTRALVIWSDAGLMLGPNERVILSRPDGSFLANLGWLDIQGATLSGSSTPNQTEPSFRPFVLTAGRGNLTVSNASFAHLGFGDTARFGGVAVDNSGLVPPKTQPFIINTQFKDVKSLAFISTRSARAQGNMMHSSSIMIANALNTTVTDNVLNAANSAAIRITKASVETLVANNIILGAPLGIAADQASHRLTLTSNILAGQTSSAIQLDKVGCAEVTGNLAVRGLGSAMTLSATGRVAIGANVILDNLGAGIVLRRQGATASVRVTGNQIAHNREGLRGATAGDLILSGNDLEGQLPRLFSGDLSARTIHWLEQRRSQGPTLRVMDAAPICPVEGNI